MIIHKRKSYGNTTIVYYCNSEFLIENYKGEVPLMYCGFYIEVAND